MKDLNKHLENLAQTVINIAKESGIPEDKIKDNIEGLTLAALAQEAESLKKIHFDFFRNKKAYTAYFYKKLTEA